MINRTRQALLSATTPTILAQQIWQAGAGLVTVALITTCLSPDEQGWYYTLLSLAALATLIDFGLSQVLVQRAARLFMALRWQDGTVRGPSAESFTALAAWSVRTYARLGLLFAALILPAGFLFFERSGQILHEARPVFTLLMLATAVALIPQPLLFLIEGSGRVAPIYALRLGQGMLGSAGCWLILLAGGGLWALLVAPVAALAVPAIVLARFLPGLLRHAWAPASAARVAWRRDLWPLQWRVGIALLSGYLLSQIATPILFAAEGARAAGQMGLSLALCNMIGLMARARLIGHVPAMTQAALSGDWTQLDRLYRSDFLWLLLIFAAALVGCVVLAPWFETAHLGERILPIPAFLLLLAAIFANTLQTMLAAQLRAFGHEPLAAVSVAGAVLTVIGAAWAAPGFGSFGVASAMLGVQLLAVLPASFLLWLRFQRLRRHAPSPADDCHPDL